MKEEIVINALRKARIYINTVQTWHRLPVTQKPDMDTLLDTWTAGGEVEAIDSALQEFGIII